MLFLASDLGTLMTKLVDFEGRTSGEHYVEQVEVPEETQAVLFGLGSSGAATMVNGATMIANRIEATNSSDSDKNSKNFAEFLFSSTAENVWICWSGHWYGKHPANSEMPVASN